MQSPLKTSGSSHYFDYDLTYPPSFPGSQLYFCVIKLTKKKSTNRQKRNYNLLSQCYNNANILYKFFLQVWFQNARAKEKRARSLCSDTAEREQAELSSGAGERDRA